MDAAAAAASAAAAAAVVAASVQADRAQLLFRLAGSSPCVVGDWPRIDLLVLKDGTCVKGLWHAPTHCVAAAQCAARAARHAGQRRTTTMHSLHSQRSTCAVLHNLASFCGRMQALLLRANVGRWIYRYTTLCLGLVGQHYPLDVLWGQLINLIQGASTSELVENQ